MMASRLVIGLDLGGTLIKAALLDHEGHIKSVETLETGAEAGPDQVIERLALAAKQVCAAAKVRLSDVLGIGLGSPGPLRVDSGTVLRAANLPGWDGVPLRDRVAKLTGRPVALVNDASAACFGEYWRGAGQGARSAALLTLGTGVGGGFVLAGELLIGDFDNATEFGHMIVHPGGRACRCGQHGCLEVYAGGSYMIERALSAGVFEPGRPQEMPELLRRAQAGHAAARVIWLDCCQAIAVTCINLQHALNPEIILLGGGIANAADAVLRPVREAHREMVWQLTDDAPRIELAGLGASAGALGAAGWFLHLHERGRL